MALLWQNAGGASPRPAEGRDSYAGAGACSRCHAGVHQEWSGSGHAKTMQRASAQNVKGDFTRGTVVLRGAPYAVQYRDQRFYITESELSGRPWEHEVEYTLGGRRFQHYLATLPDGQIVVLPPTWDIGRKEWVLARDIGNPEEGSGGTTPLWNKTCGSCHASQVAKNFDLENLRYGTTWTDLGVNCEACHGPGAEHVALARKAGGRSGEAGGTVARAASLDAGTREEIRQKIVNPKKLDAAHSTMICAQCHSLRDVYAAGFKAGDDYGDFYLAVLEYRLPASEDGAYWGDGRPRQMSNEAIGLWQSPCFLKGGATCATCHTQLHASGTTRGTGTAATGNALCTACHKAIVGNVPGHTHHAANSVGSRCVECHMPAVVASLKTRMRDHSIGIPTPENTLRHGIPNACNACHKEKDAAWSVDRMNAWYGETARERRQKWIERADAFTEARRGDPAAIAELQRILQDTNEAAWIRANAAGYLSGYAADPGAYGAVLRALNDPAPLVRATAATALRPSAAQREALAIDLVGLLKDPVRTVRMSAAIAMVAMGVKPFEGEDGKRYEEAKEEYAERAELNADDAQQQLAAGRFFFLAGNMARAAQAFRATLKLDGTIPAQYYLGRTLAEEGDYSGAREVLNGIPREDRQYDAAQRLLGEIGIREAQPSAGTANSGAGDSAAGEQQFLAGQTAYQSREYGGALKDLQEALQAAPQAGWAETARIYRAICLEKLGRASEAEEAMQALSGLEGAQENVDLQLAYAELLDDTGRPEEALKRVEALSGAVPKAPEAYFWRAKLLLELRRTDAAASAAEEAVRLRPEFVEGHNLLLKIYQKQGRAKEAAQEAEWLREHERRNESQ